MYQPVDIQRLETDYLNRVAGLLSRGVQVPDWHKFKSKSRNINGFYNRRLGLVVKKPAFILEHRTPIRFRVKTVTLKDGWVGQPLLVRTRLNEAVGLLRKGLKPYLSAGFCVDLHSGNVGWYGKKPLLLDW
jgi:hypothetical protein